MRRTKIVCTIGPASSSLETIKAMIQAGMDIARFNFSHGTHEEHGQRMALVRQAAEELGKRMPLMLDNKGPEIRLGEVEGKVLLEKDKEVILTTEPVVGNALRLPVNFEGLPQDVRPGDSILLDDGLIELEVLETTTTEIRCRIKNGGVVSSHKGVNVPGVELGLPPLTDQDIEDLEFGLKQGIDFWALSFVRTANDILAAREELEKRGAHSQVFIIAKIETRAAVNNLEDILAVSDGIMVARGDLGVEIPVEEVPLVQKRIIQACNRLGKPVITATQMLESMIQHPRPTRAEAADVANAIFDGTDAIMLSGETAAGKYPVESVATMARIARRAEEELPYTEILRRRNLAGQASPTEAISFASCTIAHELKASAIITPTVSGATARRVAQYRPSAPIIAVSPNEKVLNHLCLVWGVQPFKIEPAQGIDEMISSALATALFSGIVKEGDLVVITAGIPGVPGATSLVKVHVMGEVLARGRGIGRGVVTGRARIINTPEDLLKVEEGDILIARETDDTFLPAFQKAAAVITEEGGLGSHAASAGFNLCLPVIIEARGIRGKVIEGMVITLDISHGLIYKGETRVL